MKDIALALKTPLSTVYLWHGDWAATGAGAALSAVSKIRETSSHELFKQGVSAKAVAERLKASLPTVYFWKKNWLAGGGIPGVLTSVAARRVGAHALFAQGRLERSSAKPEHPAHHDLQMEKAVAEVSRGGASRGVGCLTPSPGDFRLRRALLLPHFCPVNALDLCRD